METGGDIGTVWMGAGAGPIGVPVPGIGMRSPGIGGGGFARSAAAGLIANGISMGEITNMLKKINPV